MKSQKKISFLIPILNEECSIGWVLDRISQFDFVQRTIIIDGGSTDKSIEICKSYKCEILYQKSKGKGGAIIEALDYFDPNEWVVMIDGDGTYDPKNAELFIPFFKEGLLINGSRFGGKIHEHSMTVLNFLGNKGLNLILNILFQKRITDLLSGMKGFLIKDMMNLHLSTGYFEIETEMVIKAIKNLQFMEIPIEYYPRFSKSKMHPFHDGMNILKRIIIEKFQDF